MRNARKSDKPTTATISTTGSSAMEKKPPASA